MPRTLPALAPGARAALFVVGASLFFSLLIAGQNHWREMQFGPAPVTPFGLTLYVAFSRWVLYGLLALGVGSLIRRWPRERGVLLPRVALHAVAGVLFTVVHLALLVVLYRLAHVYPQKDSMLEAFRRLMFVNFGLNYFIYMGIAGIGHAWVYS